MEKVVTCEDVSRIYRQGPVSVAALSGINLEIGAGDFVCFCGPSGSGKTTLLNMIGGLDVVSSGRITVAGQRLHELDSAELAELRLRKIGFVFQAYNLVPVLSARENVEMVMQLQGIDKTARRKRAMSILKEVGLAGLEERRPDELSGGQQQRVAVARAIVSEPSIILADEPTANLDSETAGMLMDMMRRMNEEHGATFVIATHDPRVMARARRLVTLKDGRIAEDVIQR